MDWAKYAPDMKPTSFDGELSKIPDGDYLFQINSIETKQVREMDIIEMEVQILTAGPCEGMKVKRPTFIKDQATANRWAYDLSMLGFDVNAIRQGDPNEQGAKVLRVMNGMSFMGKKTTTEEEKNGQKKVYHNINIKSRGQDGKPEKIGTKELDELGAAVSFG